MRAEEERVKHSSHVTCSHYAKKNKKPPAFCEMFQEQSDPCGFGKQAKPIKVSIFVKQKKIERAQNSKT